MFDGELIALKEAVSCGNLNVAQDLVRAHPALLNHGDDYGRGWLHFAAEHGQPAMIRWLVEAGLDVNKADRSGCSPLWHAAVLHDPWETVQTLLDVGANPDTNYLLGTLSGLAVADASPARLSIMRLLLQHGASPQTRDVFDRTPLRNAVFRGDRDMVMLLLEYGARAEYEDAGMVDLAVDWGHSSLAQEMQAWMQAHKAMEIISCENKTEVLKPLI